jgi:succinate dehydrogenase/fumarate reductase flavoprotein subunit
VGTDPRADVAADIAALDASIESEAVAAESALVHALPASQPEPARGPPEHQELCRQLSALRRRVARARSELTDPRALRAELATLGFFAQMLRADADRWQARAHEALAELARREAAIQREQERLSAERDELLRRRDALQAEIDRTAAEMAEGRDGECRRTVPVIQFADAVTVSSITVSTPRRLFRAMRLSLVTLSEDRDSVLVKPD